MTYQKKNKLHIVAVTALIINKEGKLLVVKRSMREIAFPGRWALPGGKLEDNETVMEGLKKECKEEVGIEIENKKIYVDDNAFVRPDNQTVKVFCYLVFAKGLEVKLNKDDFDEYQWAGIEEIGEYEVLGMDREKLNKVQKVLNL
ncbi:hypothetical protein A3H03_00600 [Candidatus Kuenenbacteria bacterium RIFCSPLOWO2_12_FULL_42_13]|uniref:NUDIX hydrolase n=5 Tax=Candidatus Kueneniibacteriota TaxID=1752740 RepID=A0A0G0Z017_9BACT|nr:MAG: NUDIX hydrolase [Candidatus Kuenenbacteria bacterium GW2011_GWA2_42_15]OGG89606.1 MAG: hypothetical protein A3C68_01440 [Candidatus Kuenenbacteria bacterium RIFCSPHIGHO2_02_FULL_42_29]OGG89755.1 MAG: hypothetical protein A3H55_03620 [Candidatus Kuenenbacteria bacterium RIFCSPLOWO2_02_FULL_42_16]OGG91288.1 MAG: hypothetical protein A3H03_00600 [Candidatus Kuenenbacteria bacterium RIFCSPLOWO2_12_FULL_42_13]OGG98507.1 MAG: hypothetical protein A3E04_02675 [Candidatus Kuenenbacteria bacteri